MSLTKQQLRYFDTFGFLKFSGLFLPEIDKIVEQFELVWENHGGGHFGKPHDHKQRSALIQFIDLNEYLSGLIDDPRLDEIAVSLLGEDYNYTGSDGNFYVGDTLWHSDGYHGGKYTSIKIGFYLDTVTKNTGCLRVIPGSHKYDDRYANTLEKLRAPSNDRYKVNNRSEELWGIAGNEVPSLALETVPGDVILFNHRIKHSSWGGGTRRRMFTINYEMRYADEDIEELKKNMGQETRFWIDRHYGDIMVKTASRNRMIHLEQRLANDGHMAELARKARDDMNEPSRG